MVRSPWPWGTCRRDGAGRAAVPRRPRLLSLQILVGVSAILVVWKIGEWAGAYDDEDPEGCSDCGELYAFSVVAALANCVGWTVGTLLGGVIRFVIRR